MTDSAVTLADIQAAAVGLAAVLSHPRRFVGKRVAIVFSGGNVDLDQLPW